MKLAIRPSFRHEAASSVIPTNSASVAVAATICSGVFPCETSANSAPVSIPMVAVVLMLRRREVPKMA